jgi:hypothetical protein
MRSFAHQTISVAGVALRLSLRSRSFGAISLLAVLGVAAATLPVSPGLTAGEIHYLKAGASTLLLGGIVLSLIVLTRVHPAGRGRIKEEAVLSLPLDEEVLTLGALIGFCGALGVFFAAGGGAYFAVAELCFDLADPGALVHAVARAFCLALITAALVAALATILAPLPALAAAILFIIGGQTSALWPAALSALLPPFDILDPTAAAALASASAAGADGAGAGAAVLLRGAACLGLYVCIAGGVQRLRRALR